MDYDREFLTGTVGVLILSLLDEREMYGYELLRETERRSSRAFHLKEGTLYPVLYRLEDLPALEPGRPATCRADPQCQQGVRSDRAQYPVHDFQFGSRGRGQLLT